MQCVLAALSLCQLNFVPDCQNIDVWTGMIGIHISGCSPHDASIHAHIIQNAIILFFFFLPTDQPSKLFFFYNLNHKIKFVQPNHG